MLTVARRKLKLKAAPELSLTPPAIGQTKPSRASHFSPQHRKLNMHSLVESIAHDARHAGPFLQPHLVAKRLKVGRFSSDWPASKKVMLVDDDAGVREMPGRALQAEGYEVIPAVNG